MTSGGDLQPNRAKDTKYDIDMKSPATSRYIGQTGGHQARRPKVYLGLDRDPVLVGIVRPPHSARRLCQRIPQIIAPPPHLQRSPARPVFQYLGSCQPALLPSANLAFQLCFNFQTCVSSLCSNCTLLHSLFSP